MSIKKFNPQDLITNTMRTHPSCEFFVTDGQVYYNNIPYASGTLNRGASVPVTSGYASLYEMNVDRLSGSTGRFIGGHAEPNEPFTYTLIDPGDGSDPIWVAGVGNIAGHGTTQFGYSQAAAAGLQGWWTLGAISGDLVVDKTGNNNGTAAAGMGTTSVAGSPISMLTPTGRAIEFDGDAELGDEDYINIGTAATWDALIGTGGTSLMSFAIWAYFGTSWDINDRFFQFGDAGNAAGQVFAQLTSYGGDAVVLFYTGFDGGTNGWWQANETPLATDQWHHLVITYDPSSVSNVPIIYINGVRVSVDTTYTPVGTWQGIQDGADGADSGDCFIGNRSDLTRTWQGMLAQFSVWNVILTSEDVLALYEASKGEVYTTYGGYIPSGIIDNGLIYPYVTKDGTRVSLSSVTTGSSYDLDFQYGDIVSGSYPLSASIKRELIGWYPAANGADAAADGGAAPNGWLTANGPYNRDESGGSRGAGQRDTGYPYLLPDNVSLTTEDVDSELPGGTLYGGQQCGDTTTWYSGIFAGARIQSDWPNGMACNSPKWPHYWALKNTLNNNVHLSQHYAVTGATSQYSTPEWIKDQQIINLISIPSIFYGSKIKPGSVSLRWYLTGTLIAELQDTKQNGELIEITTSNPYVEQYGAGNVAGVVLYNEGFILLTGSWALNEAKGAWSESTKKYNGGMITIRSGSGNTPYSPMWIDWGAGANDNTNKLTTSTSGNIGAGSATGVPPLVVSASNNFESASFGLSFKGTSETQVLTMFTNARRGEVNFSNNPTYLAHTASVTSSFTTSSYAYIENPDRLVYSFASSSAMDHSASYKREVYISRVGIYDENKNLIGVATMSNPVRKEEDQDLTFKLKLDI